MVSQENGSTVVADNDVVSIAPPEESNDPTAATVTTAATTTPQAEDAPYLRLSNYQTDSNSLATKHEGTITAMKVYHSKKNLARDIASRNQEGGNGGPRMEPIIYLFTASSDGMICQWRVTVTIENER